MVMMPLFLGLLALFSLGFSSPSKLIAPIGDDCLVKQGEEIQAPKEEILASQTLDLSKRDKNEFVNRVFKDNILLALFRLGKPAFNLQPGEIFAFHENVLSAYRNKLMKTIGSHFTFAEGFRSSGWLVGDGVCHLASLMNWVASEAGLKVRAEMSHDFRPIPDIPPEYSVSIRYAKTGHNSQRQNLYIENDFDFPVEFRFKLEEEKLKLEIIKDFRD